MTRHPDPGRPIAEGARSFRRLHERGIELKAGGCVATSEPAWEMPRLRRTAPAALATLALGAVLCAASPCRSR